MSCEFMSCDFMSCELLSCELMSWNRTLYTKRMGVHQENGCTPRGYRQNPSGLILM